MKKFFLLGFYLTVISSVCCQNLTGNMYSESIDHSTYKVGETKYDIVTYTLKNKSKEDFFFWFEEENITGWVIKKKIKSYFFHTAEDVNLFLLIADRHMKNNAAIIYQTFLKKIPVKSEFVISITGVDKNTKLFIDECKTFFKKHTVIASLADITEYTQLNKYESEEIYYKGNYINIPYELLPK